jgi:chromosome partitioning protein
MTTNATASSGASQAIVRQTDSYVIMLTLSLAAHTAAANGRALVVDVDPQATSYDMTQLLQDPGYDAIHEIDPVQLTRIRQLREYDTIFVDCPGSLEGHDVLAEVLARSSFVLIPFDNEVESLMPTIRTVEKVRDAGVPYAAVVTKADPRLGAEHILDAWATLDSAGVRHFRGVIRHYRAWPNSLKAGVPITRWNERYAPRLREDIAALHTEVLLELGRLAPAGTR